MCIFMFLIRFYLIPKYRDRYKPKKRSPNVAIAQYNDKIIVSKINCSHLRRNKAKVPINHCNFLHFTSFHLITIDRNKCWRFLFLLEFLFFFFVILRAERSGTVNEITLNSAFYLFDPPKTT